MDKDRIEGAAKSMKGSVKDAAGKITGDTKMQAEGKADKMEGKVQNAVGGAKDAMRDVARQLVRNREAFGKKPEDMPVFGTSAATFNDDGVTALYQHLRGELVEHGLVIDEPHLPAVSVRHSSGSATVVPPTRVRYLAEIAETVPLPSALTLSPTSLPTASHISPARLAKCMPLSLSRTPRWSSDRRS